MSTGPGLIALTVTPRSASASASERVIWCTAPFVTAYASSSAIGARCWPEVNRTIRPSPRAGSCCAAYACTSRTTARALTAHERSSSSAVTSSSVIDEERAWLATSTSTAPKVDGVLETPAGAAGSARSASTCASRGPDPAELVEQRLDAAGSAPHGCSASCAAHEWIRTRCAVGKQAARDGEADALAAADAGDDRDAAQGCALALRDEVVRVHRRRRADGVQPRHLLGRQAPADRAEVVLELLDAARADDRRGDARPGQQPVDRDLRRRAPGLRGDRAHRLDDAPVALVVAPLPRLDRAGVGLGDPRAGCRPGGAVVLAGQHALGQRRPWDQADAQRLRRRADLVLQAALDQRVLRLQRHEPLEAGRAAASSALMSCQPTKFEAPM